MLMECTLVASHTHSFTQVNTNYLSVTTLCHVPVNWTHHGAIAAKKGHPAIKEM